MFKKVALALSAVFASASFAYDLSAFHKAVDAKTLATRVFGEVSTQGLGWKIGEKADYSLDLGGFLKGTMNMFVREETSEGIWLQQDIDIQVQQSKVETLFDKETGQVKKVLVDGQEQKLEQGKPGDQEIVESRPDTVQVPAGNFECSYVKIHNKSDNSDAELWLNPEIVPIVGLIKQISQSQFGPVTLELTAFDKK